MIFPYMELLMDLVGRSLVKSLSLKQFTIRVYVDYIKDISGCPLLLRTDCGEEKLIMAGVSQCFFRLEDDEPMSKIIKL